MATNIFPDVNVWMDAMDLSPSASDFYGDNYAATALKNVFSGRAGKVRVSTSFHVMETLMIKLQERGFAPAAIKARLNFIMELTAITGGSYDPTKEDKNALTVEAKAFGSPDWEDEAVLRSALRASSRLVTNDGRLFDHAFERGLDPYKTGTLAHLAARQLVGA